MNKYLLALMLITHLAEAEPCREEVPVEYLMRYASMADAAEACLIELQDYSEDGDKCREFENAWFDEHHIDIEAIALRGGDVEEWMRPEKMEGLSRCDQMVERVRSAEPPEDPPPRREYCEPFGRSIEYRKHLERLNTALMAIHKEVRTLTKDAKQGDRASAIGVVRINLCETFWECRALKSQTFNVEASKSCLESLKVSDSPELPRPCVQYRENTTERLGHSTIAYVMRHLGNPKWFGSMCSEKYEDTFWTLYDEEGQIVSEMQGLGYQ